ncbi:MAG: hypothetical protein HKP13_01095 [Gammaproteobacteria bacterium]|nr:hypothetical protein [Gammaproteobacteria bacterium]
MGDVLVSYRRDPEQNDRGYPRESLSISSEIIAKRIEFDHALVRPPHTGNRLTLNVALGSGPPSENHPEHRYKLPLEAPSFRRLEIQHVGRSQYSHSEPGHWLAQGTGGTQRKTVFGLPLPFMAEKDRQWIGEAKSVSGRLFPAQGSKNSPRPGEPKLRSVLPALAPGSGVPEYAHPRREQQIHPWRSLHSVKERIFSPGNYTALLLGTKGYQRKRGIFAEQVIDHISRESQKHVQRTKIQVEELQAKSNKAIQGNHKLLKQIQTKLTDITRQLSSMHHLQNQVERRSNIAHLSRDGGLYDEF